MQIAKESWKSLILKVLCKCKLVLLNLIYWCYSFQTGLGETRHLQLRGFRFRHSSNLPLRKKCCHIYISHYQSLVLFYTFTKYKRNIVFKQSSPCWSWRASTPIPLEDRFFISFCFKVSHCPPKAQNKPLQYLHSAGKLPLLQPHQQLKKCCHTAHPNPSCCSLKPGNKHSSIHR